MVAMLNWRSSALITNSAFTIQHSQFNIHNSTFTIQHSQFNISVFTLHSSLFTLRPSLFVSSAPRQHPRLHCFRREAEGLDDLLERRRFTDGVDAHPQRVADCARAPP